MTVELKHEQHKYLTVRVSGKLSGRLPDVRAG
jgi:hypothetical protein